VPSLIVGGVQAISCRAQEQCLQVDSRAHVQRLTKTTASFEVNFLTESPVYIGGSNYISACLLVANLNIAYFGWLPK